MAPTKTLQQREQELGRRYQAAGGRRKPANRSIITFMLVYERERGLIAG